MLTCFVLCFKCFYLMEVQLTYNILLVSDIQHGDLTVIYKMLT